MKIDFKLEDKKDELQDKVTILITVKQKVKVSKKY